jgi:hypothetical protein
VVVAWLIAVKKSRNWESLTSMRLKTLILEKCAKRNNADGGDISYWVLSCALDVHKRPWSEMTLVKIPTDFG